MSSVNLLGFGHGALEAFFKDLDEPAFRARQVFKWIHQHSIDDFSLMTNVSKALRRRLSNIAEIRTPEIVSEQPSVDGVYKWLLRLSDEQCIETVFISEGDRINTFGIENISEAINHVLRGTLVLSSLENIKRNEIDLRRQTVQCFH